jgi:hypothetical protein
MNFFLLFAVLASSSFLDRTKPSNTTWSEELTIRPLATEVVYLKDNSSESQTNNSKEASLLKKEQELLAAEKALLKKENLLLKDTTPSSMTSVTDLSKKNDRAGASFNPEKKEHYEKQPSPVVKENKETVAVPEIKKTATQKRTQPAPVLSVHTETIVDAEKLAEVEKKLTAQTKKNQSLQDKNRALLKKATSLEKKLAEKEKKLANESRKASEATRAVNEIKARLMLAETQVERLSSIIETQNNYKVSQMRGQKPTESPSPSTRATRSRLPVAPSVQSSAAMPIATVTHEKTYLRTGPGNNNSPLMAVTKGTRLAVETMQAGWYRVITPTGARAWVAKSDIAFGNNGEISPITRSNNSSNIVEDRAFELIKSP